MGTGTLEMVLSGLGEAAGALGNAAVQLYTFIAITLLYFDCRRRREGEDLDQALDQLGAPRLSDLKAGPSSATLGDSTGDTVNPPSQDAAEGSAEPDEEPPRWTP
ncbi:MAG: hypothetical protein SX243_24235, partial [Acidobacteriota bacterium]|nr:hypothetical protein [Acidobacteriota bacterium]